MRDFKELQVWQKSHRFALDVDRQTRNFPADDYPQASELMANG